MEPVVMKDIIRISVCEKSESEVKGLDTARNPSQVLQQDCGHPYTL